MKLQAWLNKKNQTREWFGQQFEPTPVSSKTVDGWCHETNHKTPQPRYRSEISRITGGKVTLRDFT